MDERIDNGDIILQYPFQISNNDTIEDVNSKMNSAAYEGIKVVCQKFISEPNCAGVKQKYELANYWRMRTPHDITLDLRMPADFIMKLVRSFTFLYPCANLIYDKYVIKIKEATLMNTEKYYGNLQRAGPGRIISIDSKKITAKAGDKIIELLSIDPLPIEMTTAKYIHPPSKYIMQHNIKFD